MTEFPITPLFTESESDSIASLGESSIIECIKNCMKECVPPSPQGIGDDCAVITPPSKSKILATTDGIIAGIHFYEDTPPELVGAKLLKRNLSDIAAMGGTPAQALLAIAASSNLSTAWLSLFCKGLAITAQRYQIKIIGGDVSDASSQSFTAYITMLGNTTHPVLRNTAQAGESIYITGTLGGSILHKHLHFEPRTVRKSFNEIFDHTERLPASAPPRHFVKHRHLCKPKFSVFVNSAIQSHL